MTTPRLRAAPGSATLDPRGAGATAASLAGGSGLPLALEDVGDDAALRIEELVVHLAPPAELVDLEQLRRDRVRLRVREARIDGAVALLREDPLCGRAAEEGEEVTRRLRRVARHSGRILDQDRLVGDDVVDVLALLPGGDGLVLVGDEDVALAGGEGLERLARALVEYGHVVEQLRQVVLGLVLRLALLKLRPVRGHDVPLGATGGVGIRRDHLDARLDQVVPALDVL